MKIKKAYIVTKEGQDIPEFSGMRNKEIERYCQEHGYIIIGGTTVSGPMTDEIRDQILARINEMEPDTVVAHKSQQFGRDLTSITSFARQIWGMGVDIETTFGDMPDAATFSMLTAMQGVAEEMAQQYEEDESQEDFEGYDPEEETVASDFAIPDSTAEHWNAELPEFAAGVRESEDTPATKCAIYVRQDAEPRYCDELTLDEQRDMLRKRAEQLGYTVSDEVQACERRGNAENIGLRLLKKVIVEKNVDKVLVMGYDVFSDDALMCAEIIDELKCSGVEIEQVEDCNLRISAADFFQMR